MVTWLVFLKGMTEEFVLPVMAPRREDALKAAASAYPAPGYQVLTSYDEIELQGVLSAAQEWQRDVPADTVDDSDTPVEEMRATPPVQTAPQAQALTSVRKQSLQKKRPVAVPLPAPGVAAAPVIDAPVVPPIEAQPIPQDLKTMLALLKASASAAAAETTQAPVQLEGRVEETVGAPVSSVPLGTVFESRPVSIPAPSPAISRRPAAEAMPVPQARSMAEVLKSLRK